MKIGIIGMGYWGKIILKNLESMGKKDITICDILLPENNIYDNYNTLKDFRELECDYVFISTPTKTHYEISKYFLEKNINVFCEKPLTLSSSKAEQLYNIALKNKVILFTDWVFTFNNQIEVMKRDYINGKLGKIKSIFMNRLNLGPERFDVNARWDLASHDVSIIQYIFSKEPKRISWTDYRRNRKSQQEDSSLGLIEYEDFSATINVSWYYRKKVRECVFEFENYFIVWDDFKRFLQYEDASNISFPIYSGNLSYPCSEYQPPLKNSINSFFRFSEEEMLYQKDLTINTIKILEV
ncbi:MAG: Gfo/Idh/MocA family protein [Candidatus Thorarchaeota archaeon]